MQASAALDDKQREYSIAAAPPAPARRPDTLTRVCSAALALGIPASALALAVSCLLVLVPVLGLVVLPAAGVCFLVLCYSVTGFAYIQLAQVDAPPIARKPFFRLGLPRNFTLGIRLVRWTFEFVTLAARLGLQWCIREVVVSRSKEEIAIGPITYTPGHTLNIYRPPVDPAVVGAAEAPPILVLLPPPALPLPAGAKDVLLALAGHRLRLAPALVVVPSAQTFPSYPAAQLEDSVAHTRDLLRWVAANAEAFGGDPAKLYVLGHGAAGVVAVWAGGLRDAIVESRKAFLWRRWRRKKGLSDEARWDLGDSDEAEGPEVERDGAPDLGELDGDGVDEVPNGLKMVDIWGGPDPPPPVAGVILLSAPADIPLQIREEASLYIEHLSYTRRYFGPAHVKCMLASPSQCLYAAKSVLDLQSPHMIQRWLLVHGGKDLLVPPTQAAMMQELLLGLGLSDVQLRAYRDMGHFDSILALAKGSNNHYSALVMRDIRSFIYPSTA